MCLASSGPYVATSPQRVLQIIGEVARASRRGERSLQLRLLRGTRAVTCWESIAAGERLSSSPLGPTVRTAVGSPGPSPVGELSGLRSRLPSRRPRRSPTEIADLFTDEFVDLRGEPPARPTPRLWKRGRWLACCRSKPCVLGQPTNRAKVLKSGTFMKRRIASSPSASMVPRHLRKHSARQHDRRN